jgi:TetR/AcrR family acrAB operon transcriptional repressor
MARYFIKPVPNDARCLRVPEILWGKGERVGDMATIRDKHLECGNRYLSINEEVFRLAREHGYQSASLDSRCGGHDGLAVNWTPG